MIICWDNLDKVHLGRVHFVHKIRGTLYYKESCRECNEPYLGKKNENFCSKGCGTTFRNKGSTLSEEIKQKISKTRIQRGVSKGHKNPNYGKGLFGKDNPNYGKGLFGKDNPKWKGGGKYTPFDTYGNQIDYAEEVRCKDQNILEARCTYCGKWFVPTKRAVSQRVMALNGNLKGEQRLYCSDGCKAMCPAYRQSPENLMKRDMFAAGLILPQEINREIQPELRKMVLERDNWTCQKCNDTNKLHCHHIDPVSLNPIESADVDNCITLCVECHKKVHKIPGCTYYELRSC